jgi:hydrogenase maturation protein HypF
VRLPSGTPTTPLLAVGGELKSTFCLTKGDHAFMSQHIGDMENLETLDSFAHSVEHFTTLFRAQPQAIACDQHPRYLSSRWARDYATEHDLPLIEVQHHHAHIAAVMAEHERTASDTVLGFSFDGTGYGTDGTIWGGEVLQASYTAFERAYHLAYMPLPGGDATVKNPYRLALAYLWACGVEWDAALPPVAHSTQVERRVLHQQLTRNLNTVQTSSMGRLFDVVAALIGVRQQITYEAQAAIELEAYVDDAVTDAYPLNVEAQQIDLTDLLRQITHDVLTEVPKHVIATRFHNTVADLVLTCSQQVGVDVVALSGGVFQNIALLHRTIDRLRAHHITALTHRHVPPNDGGLALGQAVIAAHQLTHPK